MVSDCRLAGVSTAIPGSDSPTPAAASRKPTEPPTTFRFCPQRKEAREEERKEVREEVPEGASPKLPSRALSLRSPLRPRIMEDFVGKPRALIVDDEAPARLRLRELLERIPSVVLSGECASGAEAVAAVRDLRAGL